VPVRVLPDYIAQVLEICRLNETPVTMYAHASVGLIHVRPILSLKDQADIDRMKRIAESAFELVCQYGGSFSGEHGDGLVRSAFLERFYGPRIYEAFRQVKALFDPQGLMNPHKIVDAPAMDENLRYGTSYRVPELNTTFHFHHEGGFAAAVETCNGVGACRKTLGGTMCPSYMALRDEEHSTRGRANALRLAMSGQLGPQGLGDKGVYDVLDLCLSCKGCKSECPSNVDMARLKSEFLQHYHDHHGVSLRDRMVAKSPELAARFAGGPAKLVNAVQGSSLMRGLLNRLVGLDARRTPPAYATEPFGAWFASRQPQVTDQQRRVVLFDDTWLNYHEPRVGISAVELLESCGYEVVLAQAGCCQRPRISHGLLREAKLLGEQTLRKLDVWLRDGIPVVCCEPSCCSALNDDLPDMLDDPELADRARTGIRMIDVFLAEELTAGRLSGPFESRYGTLRIHGHCHQKALYGTASMKTLLGLVEGLDLAELETGCCGMAGSFGYEAEHYDLSVKVAEDRLLPAVADLAPDIGVIACGFSCRHQLADLAHREAVHFVETLRRKPPG
jgi:Fe-S oxidoreductase